MPNSSGLLLKVSSNQDDSKACDKLHISHFSECQWPDTLGSDNGSCLNATEFRQAIEYMGIHNITSSSDYHQCNRLAEKYVQLLKSLLSKAKKTGKNLHFALMLCRNTTLGNDLQSKWSYCVPGKLDPTCQCHIPPRYKWNKLQVSYHKLM